MIRCILISGPPGSGKDTAGKLLKGRKHKFAQPLIDIAAAAGFDMEEDRKNEPHHLLGISRRQFMINIANLYWELFTNKVFGYLLLERAIDDIDDGFRIVITDSGFRWEADVLTEVFEPGEILRIHLHREGCDFAIDSRSDWKDIPGTHRRDVINNGDLLDFRATLESAIASCDDEA